MTAESAGWKLIVNSLLRNEVGLQSRTFALLDILLVVQGFCETWQLELQLVPKRHNIAPMIVADTVECESPKVGA